MLPTLCTCAKASSTKATNSPHLFKRAQKGLFGGKTKLFGNNVPESHQKTRRTWLPNIQPKKLYSASLDQTLKLKVTTAVLREMDRCGGLDQYLLKRWKSEKETEMMLGKLGLSLRNKVIEARSQQSEEAQTGTQQRARNSQLIREAFSQARLA